MIKFQTGDIVVASVPALSHAPLAPNRFIVLKQDKKLITCLYLNKMNEPISVQLLVDWIVKEYPDDNSTLPKIRVSQDI
jgi:hypothetical protein